MKVLIILLFVMKFVSAQVFSSNILIYFPTSNSATISYPAIGMDSNGIFGVTWTLETLVDVEVNFVKSYDMGQSFDSLRIVDFNPTPPYFWFYPSAGPIVYDYQDNPLVFYLTADWSGVSSSFRARKSLDGGNSYTLTPFSFSGYEEYDYIFSDDTTGFLANHVLGKSIRIYKTVDGGMSFYPVYTINCGNYAISQVKIIVCDNSDILCFWTGQHQVTFNTNTFYSRSTDGGNTFSEPITLNNIYDFANRVTAATFQNFVYIVYQGGYSSGEVYIIFQKSYDYGYSYDPPVILHDYTNSGIGVHPLPEIRINKNVGLGIIWGEWIPVYFVYSSDFGESFDSTVILPNSPGRGRLHNSMSISDSGDVCVVSKIDGHGGYQDSIVLNKAKLPVLSSIEKPKFMHRNISTLELYQNYPNPFNLETKISFYLPKRSFIELNIYDLNGRLVSTLIAGKLKEGRHEYGWDGSNINGHEASSGVYIYHLKSENYSESRKLVILK